jgi:putative phosphoribosyl transferase
MQTRFRDRYDAGRYLSGMLASWEGAPDLIVLALPRGGVPVAYEIALALRAPLDIFLVRKLGVPGHSELAMGAIAQGGVTVLNDDVVRQLSITPETIERVAERERRELERRSREYRGPLPEPDVAGRTVILVDDGLATGSTMLAALQALRHQRPARIIVSAPVASPQSLANVKRLADETVCPLTPDPLYAVGAWYDDFSETSDDDVRLLLRQAAAASAA